MPPPAGVQQSPAATAARATGHYLTSSFHSVRRRRNAQGSSSRRSRVERQGGARLPGVVEPNAYRQVVVTPLVAGHVRSSGGRSATASSGRDPRRDLPPGARGTADSLVSGPAILDAHDRELRRDPGAREIRGRRRQELEKISAEHAAPTRCPESRSQLELLGVSTSASSGCAPAASDAAVNVPPPIERRHGAPSEHRPRRGSRRQALHRRESFNGLVVAVCRRTSPRVRVRTGHNHDLGASRPVLRGRVSYIIRGPRRHPKAYVRFDLFDHDC